MMVLHGVDHTSSDLWCTDKAIRLVNWPMDSGMEPVNWFLDNSLSMQNRKMSAMYVLVLQGGSEDVHQFMNHTSSDL